MLVGSLVSDLEIEKKVRIEFLSFSRIFLVFMVVGIFDNIILFDCIVKL